MIANLVIISLFATGLIFTMFYPVFLPTYVIDGIKTVLTPIWAFAGILPIQAIFQCLNWIINFLLMFLIYKIIMGLVGLVNGSGKPEID
jgi:hypothetical protein